MLSFNVAWVSLVVLIDQVTKYVICDQFNLGEVKNITSFLDIVLVQNHGVSFGFFQAGSQLGAYLLIGVALLVSLWVLSTWRHAKTFHEHMAYGAIIGGALGNIIDRARLGYVVDFLYFHYEDLYWPAFNFADCAIVYGVGLILVMQTWQSLFK
jgi:signal peptidase II